MNWRLFGSQGKRIPETGVTMDERRTGAREELPDLSGGEQCPQTSEIGELVNTLSCHKDVTARQAAAAELGQIGGSCVAELLIAALGDAAWQVRAAAAKALGRIDDQRAVRPLIAALGDPEPDVRLAALSALSSMPSARPSEPPEG